MKISIVTVTHNCASVVADCLALVVGQTHADVECVVINSKCTDGTLAVLQAHSEQLAKLVSESDNGIYYAMNKGIRLTQEDVIGFLNSDDYYASKVVNAKVADVFEGESSFNACYADLIYT